MRKFKQFNEQLIEQQYKQIPRAFMYIADQRGQIHYSELSLLLNHYNIQPKVNTLKFERDDKIRRPESLNVVNQAQSMVESIKTNTRELPDTYDYFLSVNSFSQDKKISHSAQINSIVLNLREEIIITSSKDSNVKVWGFDGSMFGSFSILGEKSKKETSKEIGRAHV